MQITSSSSGMSPLSGMNMDEMDGRLASGILSEKDADSSGGVSADELGVSASQLSQFDTDGDGVLSTGELTAALKAQREKMQAQMQTEMSQSGQMGVLQSSIGGMEGPGQGSGQPPRVDDVVSQLFSDSQDSFGSSARGSGSLGSTDMDTLISSLFASSGSSPDDAGASAATLSDFVLRQRASSAYQDMEDLIAGLFADGGAASRSVSVSA